MKILIVYGTTEGQTRKISRFIENIYLKAGHTVELADATIEPPAPDGYDAVLIGSSIHIHKYQSALTHYISRNVNVLNKIPGAFFSVCLAVASGMEEEHREADKIKNDFLMQTGWNPLMSVQIAGALKYTEYDFFKRLIMKMISKREGQTTDTSKDHEFTDWNAVTNFANEFMKKAMQNRELNSAK